jgi:hypothetical protein
VPKLKLTASEEELQLRKEVELEEKSRCYWQKKPK